MIEASANLSEADEIMINAGKIDSLLKLMQVFALPQMLDSIKYQSMSKLTLEPEVMSCLCEFSVSYTKSAKTRNGCPIGLQLIYMHQTTYNITSIPQLGVLQMTIN